MKPPQERLWIKPPLLPHGHASGPCEDDPPDTAAPWCPEALIGVGPESPAVFHQAVYVQAVYFRREFRYDFVQYGHDGMEEDRSARAWLWADEIHGVRRDRKGRLWISSVGACCFRLREEGYALQWIWLHPFFRRQGLLRDAWPYFRKRFGDFEVEAPLSDGMAAFLKAVEPESVTQP